MWLMDKNLNIIRPHLKHITQEHIIEEKIKKMRVKHAVQVLSGHVASVIETFARTRVTVSINNEDISIDEEEGLAMMEAVYFFNQLFDSVNGDDKRHNNNELRCPVTKTSEHHAFWVSACEMLRKMSFVDKVLRNVKSVPSLANWLFTIDGFRQLWKVLRDKFEFRSLNMRNCSQDPLENFFGQIRSHAVRNVNPTPKQFEETFLTLLINNMKSASRHGNCEISDDNSLLFSLHEYLNNTDNSTCKDNDEALELISENNVSDDILNAVSLDNREHVIRSILKKLDFCTECENSLQSDGFSVCIR